MLLAGVQHRCALAGSPLVDQPAVFDDGVTVGDVVEVDVAAGIKDLLRAVEDVELPVVPTAGQRRVAVERAAPHGIAGAPVATATAVLAVGALVAPLFTLALPVHLAVGGFEPLENGTVLSCHFGTNPSPHSCLSGS